MISNPSEKCRGARRLGSRRGGGTVLSKFLMFVVEQENGRFDGGRERLTDEQL